MKFITKNSLHSTLYTGYKEMCIEEIVNTKFLGVQTDNHINLKNHTEEIIAKCIMYAVRSMVHISNINILKSIYYEPRTSCRSLFKQLGILLLPFQYIFSLMNFIINNQENF